MAGILELFCNPASNFVCGRWNCCRSRIFDGSYHSDTKIVDPSLVIGWASMMCVTMVFAGMILMCLGIVGEYLGKIILTLNHTPQFIVRETINVSEQREEI